MRTRPKPANVSGGPVFGCWSTLKQSGWELLDRNWIYLQGRIYKYSESRDVPAHIKTVTVKRDSLGNLWLYFVVEEEINQKQKHNG